MTRTTLSAMTRVTGLCLALAPAAWAGPLDPAGAPAPTGQTLDAIAQAISALPSGGAPAEIAMTVQATGGPISGEDTIAGRAGVIRVLSLDQTTTFIPTSGPTVTELTIVKKVDRATPRLVAACIGGATLPNVTFDFYRRLAPGDPPENYARIELTDAMISSYNTTTGSSGGDPVPLEQVSFNYTRIRWTYLPTGDTAVLNLMSPAAE
jgi:type VI secretion system Hcp family effector